MRERWLAFKVAIREFLHPVDDDAPDSDHDPAVILDRWVAKALRMGGEFDAPQLGLVAHGNYSIARPAAGEQDQPTGAAP